MAVQTKLQVRRDTAANWTSTNPTLASGEIGFETDTLKFKVGNGSTAWTSLKYSQDASLLNGTASITALTATGDVSAGGVLKSTQSSGDEGGQIDLTKSVTNTTITTGVSIDVYQDKLRFYETGGTNRGFYLDITGGGASAGTNLNGVIFNGGTITNALIVSNTSGVNTSGQFISTIATGTAPFVVSSTTQVANLNVAVSGIANNLTGGTANKGELVYQSGVNTTSELTAPTTNMSALLYNTSTNAPYWATPPQAMTSLMGYTSTATAAGFTSLSNTSSYYQQFTGSTTQTVVLPNTATLSQGWTFHIVNNSTGNVTANTFANAATVITIPANTTAMVTCIDTTSNTATGWEVGLTDFGTYTGTGSVVMNNTPTFTTPNIGAATGVNVNVSGQLISRIATGTAPLVVTSTTQVANLNVALSGSTSNVLGGAAGSLPYQSAANTTTYLARTATNNSTLAFNSSTNAPFWVQPTLSNTYYAATTSAQLAGVISDETGSGALVFGTTPTITPANAAAATSASQAGYIGMPLLSKSAAYGVAATDAGKVIYYTTTGQTVTIPANSNVAFEIGTTLTFITAASVSLSIAITTDTMYLAGTGTTGTRTLAQYGMATAVKITSTSWIISGNGLT